MSDYRFWNFLRRMFWLCIGYNIFFICLITTLCFVYKKGAINLIFVCIIGMIMVAVLNYIIILQIKNNFPNQQDIELKILYKFLFVPIVSFYCCYIIYKKYHVYKKNNKIIIKQMEDLSKEEKPSDNK